MNSSPRIERGSFTVREFAERHSISPMQAYRFIREGKLKAVMTGFGTSRGLRITPEAEAAWLTGSAYIPGTIVGRGGRPRKTA